MYATTAFGTGQIYEIAGGTVVNTWAMAGSGESGLAVLFCILLTQSNPVAVVDSKARGLVL